MPKTAKTCHLVSRQITVDGDPKDWDGIAVHVVRRKDQLWFGQGMTPEKWTGDDDGTGRKAIMMWPRTKSDFWLNTDENATLYQLTGDEHYQDVARILLHNTKAMVALPNRTYDLRGPGWQQEHFSLAPHRGYGLHRLWLPWVATSQLNGIFGLMELDPELFQQLADCADGKR